MEWNDGKNKIKKDRLVYMSINFHVLLFPISIKIHFHFPLSLSANNSYTSIGFKGPDEGLT